MPFQSKHILDDEVVYPNEHLDAYTKSDIRKILNNYKGWKLTTLLIEQIISEI